MNILETRTYALDDGGGPARSRSFALGAPRTPVPPVPARAFGEQGLGDAFLAACGIPDVEAVVDSAALAAAVAVALDQVQPSGDPYAEEWCRQTSSGFAR